MGDFSSGIPVGDLTARKFQPPHCTQFSCFLSNRIGKLRELIEVFEVQACKLAALSIVEGTDHAVVRIVTSRAELACRLLKRAEIPYSECEILCVEIDEDHTLLKVCASLLSAEVSIHYLYPLLVRPRRKAVIALYTDEQELAAQILREKLFTLLAENDLGDNATGSDPGDDPEFDDCF